MAAADVSSALLLIKMLEYAKKEERDDVSARLPLHARRAGEPATRTPAHLRTHHQPSHHGAGARRAFCCAWSRETMRDLEEFFRHYCRFWPEMTYDTVSYEVCITEILPGHGAIMGGKGPIQNRADFERYPWDELEARYWALAEPRVRRAAASPAARHEGAGRRGQRRARDQRGPGRLRVAGVRASRRSGAVRRVVPPHRRPDGRHLAALPARSTPTLFAICRFGDDLGFKTSTLVSPRVIRQHIIPQYQRIIDLIHAAGRPFLWHSCGCIFSVMDDVISPGHSGQALQRGLHRVVRAVD